MKKYTRNLKRDYALPMLFIMQKMKKDNYRNFEKAASLRILIMIFRLGIQGILS